MVEAGANSSKSLTPEELAKKEFEQCQLECRHYGLPDAMSADDIERENWNFVSCYIDKMHPETQLITEFGSPRYSQFSYCHPGPLPDLGVEGTHYYADSIAQEVRLIDDDTSRYFVIRWLGYEDR